MFSQEMEEGQWKPRRRGSWEMRNFLKDGFKEELKGERPSQT